MVSIINEATKKILRDFFEQDMKKFIFHENKITREAFFDKLEDFMSSENKKYITLSIDEQVEILLFLEEAFRYCICIDSDTENSERFISFYFEPCNIEEWEAMLNCIYDKKENACPF